jgi:hypothetical protein
VQSLRESEIPPFGATSDPSASLERNRSPQNNACQRFNWGFAPDCAAEFGLCFRGHDLAGVFH